VHSSQRIQCPESGWQLRLRIRCCFEQALGSAHTRPLCGDERYGRVSDVMAPSQRASI